MTTRFTLRRSDGTAYLTRTGVECRWFGVFVHHLDGPDPGAALHDHPWWFASLVLRGGYSEYRMATRTPGSFRAIKRRRWSLKTLRLDQAHSIFQTEPNTVTLVIRGPKVRPWGFVTGNGWTYWENLPREQRDLSYEDLP